MTTISPPAALVPVVPLFSEPERLALAGFLASYTGLTREAYMLDLRQFTAWCQNHDIALFAARRADIESFARDLRSPRSTPPESGSGCRHGRQPSRG